MSFASFNSSSRELLNFVSETLFQELHQEETLLVNFRGEESDFIRWNQSKVRQNTSVLQRVFSIEFHKGGRRILKGFTASGNLEWDLIEARQLLTQARLEIEAIPQDPFLIPFRNHGTSEAVFEGNLLSAEEVIPAIAEPSTEFDLAGLYAGGSIAVGNRNSLGQNHWFANESFFMDYSLYNGERAAKGVYSDFQWQQPRFVASLKETASQLAVMDRPRKKLAPGGYRVYLAPGAVAELTTMFSWNGFSYRSYKDGTSAFKKLAEHERRLSDKFSLSENFNLGLVPRFNALGELAPEKIPLVEGGELTQFLISSRSALEYGVTGNQAAANEGLRALEIHTGSLEREQILQELGTGLYLSNLHYINWSDLESARVTGMTRYACLWVEDGKVVAPIEDMRFDVSFYDILGSDLQAVTKFQEIQPAIDTYWERSLGGNRVPGMLIQNFQFTL